MSVEKASNTWRAVKAHCESEREDLIDRLIQGTDEDQAIRGAIKALDAVLALAHTHHDDDMIDGDIY